MIVLFLFEYRRPWPKRSLAAVCNHSSVLTLSRAFSIACQRVSRACTTCARAVGRGWVAGMSANIERTRLFK